ncbi:MAG: hypothetical protein IPK62_05715 [Bacteroidetes bacterium]|nr:hypothetical protein [Bacteroidota bacterium]MBK8144516.1 hypothetical protein [Bacteroidota bacterium]
MRFPLIIGILLLHTCLIAQIKVITFNQAIQENNKKSLPFYFQEIVFSEEVSDTIGLLGIEKTKGNTYVHLPKSRSTTVIDFIHSQYAEKKNGAPISMHITKLKIAPNVINQFSPKDTFQFHCKFYAAHSNEKSELFSFNAKHPFGNFNNAEEILANYICRAITSSIEKFKDFYEKNASWMQTNTEPTNSDKKTIQVQLVQNKLTSPDSLACTLDRKLRWDDFQETPLPNKQPPNDQTDLGSAKCILTYRVMAEETSKYLKLEIFVNAFFYKRNSWKPKNKSPEWLAYQQGHFDLCAIFGSQLSRKMKNHPYSLGTYKAELNALYNEVNTELIAMRKQYKSDTQEGKDVEQMVAWRKKIDGLRENN